MSNKLISLFLLLILFGSFGNLNLSGVNESTLERGLATSSIENYDTNSNDLDQTDKSEMYNDKINRVSAERITEYKEYSTEIKTNQTEYKPGDSIKINMSSSILGFNGSTSWSLKTPLNEKVIGFSKDASSVFFEDPNFENNSVPDWVNSSFSEISVLDSGLENWLNLTTVDDSQNATLVYNKYKDIKGKFDISFEYKVVATDNKANLTFSYWNGTDVQSFELTNSTTFQTFSLTGVYVNSKTLQNGLFNFTLNQSNAIWNIKPIKISYNIDNIDLTDETEKTGILENIWVHGPKNDYREKLDVKYNLLSSNDESYANFIFTLPSSQLYFGEWQFIIKVNSYNDTSSNAEQHEFIVPLVISDDVEFTLSKQYILRGVNTTSNLPVFKDETGVTKVYSPTDNISLVGELVSGENWKIDDNYFSELNGYLLFNSTGVSNLDLVWGNNFDRSLIGFNDSNSLFDGVIKNQLPSEKNNTQSWLLNYKIPNRGLYGQVNQSLYITFPSFIKTNSTGNETISDDYELKVGLDLIEIKFNLNISTTLDNLPYKRTWFITELMEGSFSVQTWRYNTDLLITSNLGSDISYNWNLSFPLVDLNLTMALNNNQTNILDQIISLNLLENNYFFSGTLDSNLKTNADYELQLLWNTPKDTNLTYMEIIPGRSITYLVRGTLTVQLPNEMDVVKQGDSLNIPFNISIDQLNNKRASGLKLQAEISGNSLSITVIEKEGTYVLLTTIPENFELGSYAINIVKESTGEKLGSIVFEVYPFKINAQDKTLVVPDLYTLIGSVLGVIVVLSFFIAILRKTK